MESQASVNTWANVDESDNPNYYVSFLDNTRAEASKLIQANPKQFFANWNVQEGFQILDVGCGTGDLIWPVATLVGNSGRVVGIDNSQIMIDEAKRRMADFGLPLDFQVGNAESLNFADNTFDICNATYLFMHLQSPQQALKEMVRVTRPGGLVSVTDLDWETILIASSDRNLTRRILNNFCDNITNGWIGRELPGMFKECGLAEVTVNARTQTKTQISENSPFHPFRFVHKALTRQIVSQAEADTWLEEQQKRIEEGRFFYSRTTFRVTGRKS